MYLAAAGILAKPSASFTASKVSGPGVIPYLSSANSLVA